MRRFIAVSVLLSLPAYAQTGSPFVDTSWAPPEAISLRDCPRPADAKEAQVIAFDPARLEAKLAVNLDDGQFKVATIRVWNKSEDPRPLVPIIEAARITQGKLLFYTPNLDADPEPVHDKQFVLIASLGRAQVCWATESAMLKQGASPRGAMAAPPTSTQNSRDVTRRP